MHALKDILVSHNAIQIGLAIGADDLSLTSRAGASPTYYPKGWYVAVHCGSANPPKSRTTRPGLKQEPRASLTSHSQHLFSGLDIVF